jgi:hypothetical protein
LRRKREKKCSRRPKKEKQNKTKQKTKQKQKQQIATMDMPFEGIPTVPPPKDRARLAFFAGGCRYLVTAAPSETVASVKEKLFAGGIARAYPGEIEKAGDIELYYACVRMEEGGATLGDYRVPAVSWGGGCCFGGVQGFWKDGAPSRRVVRSRSSRSPARSPPLFRNNNPNKPNRAARP